MLIGHKMEKIIGCNNNVILPIRCSNNCVFCRASKNDSIIKVKEMSRKDEIDLLNDTLLLVKDKSDTLSITGSEALRYSKIIDYIKWARPKFKNIIIRDPGLRLSDFDFAESLFASGIDAIEIPIYGSTAEIHNSCVGNREAFAKMIRALENITILKKSYNVNVTFRSIFLRQNSEDISRIIDLLKKYNLYLMLLYVPVIQTGLEKDSEFFAPDLLIVKDEIIKISSRLSNSNISVSYVPPCIFDDCELNSLRNIHLINLSESLVAKNKECGLTEREGYDVSLDYGEFCDECHLKINKICGGILKFYLERIDSSTIHPLSEKTYGRNMDKMIFSDENLFP